MKLLHVPLILTLIIAAFLFSGFAAALNQDEATVHTFFTPSTPQPGQTVSVLVLFTSNSPDALQITRIGLNFDWMAPDSFVGFDLSNAPVTVPAGGTYNFPQMTINIPTNVTLGAHDYYVGIDGTQGASSTLFSWNSPDLSLLVTGSNGQTAGPTVTSSPTGNDGQPSGQPDLQLYGAVAAVVVIVVLLVLVLVLRKKRTKSQHEPSQPAVQQESPPPEQRPEQKPSSDQDFDI